MMIPWAARLDGSGRYLIEVVAGCLQQHGKDLRSRGSYPPSVLLTLTYYLF